MDFHETFTKRYRGKCSFQRYTEMGARSPINFLGLRTTLCALGGDAWRVTENCFAGYGMVLVPPPRESVRISLLAMALCSYGGCIKKA